MDILVHKTTPLSLVDRFLQIFQLVTVLFVQVVAMASQIVSLKARVSKLETVPPTCSDTVELSQRVKDLCDTVASQQEEIRGLKQDLVHQRVEVDASQQKIKTLTTKFSDDGREFNAFVDGLHSTLVDHIKEQQRQASQLAKVSDDITQKIAVLDKGLSSVRLELSVATTAMTSTETQMAGQAAKEARRKHILASVAQRVEEIGLFQDSSSLRSSSQV
ncbi:hypothetical protein BS17DRAFT_238318 [Gyrodon lividus]|nr:hypothetical protein BS17DRAFT_238318 [Gyrodon lividus]